MQNKEVALISSIWRQHFALLKNEVQVWLCLKLFLGQGLVAAVVFQAVN